MMTKWRIFCSFAPSSSLCGGWGIIVPFYTVQDCNLGQIKWNIWTTPPPISMMTKWRVFCSFAPYNSSLLWGRWGIIVPFCTVQDCRYSNILSQKCSTLNKFSHERFYKQKLPVIIEVSFEKVAHFPKVPAHTGLTTLDCRKRRH